MNASGLKFDIAEKQVPSPKVNSLFVLEKIFKGFLPYMGVVAVLLMRPKQFVQILANYSKVSSYKIEFNWPSGF